MSEFADAQALAAELARAIRGEVRFDAGSRALYATDSSNYRQVPIGVVMPRDSEDVVRTVEICRRYGAPILARGGGTSLAGQCCNVAVVLDFSRHMNAILEVDPDRRMARVQPGVVLDTLRAAAEAHHLTFGPDPATHSHCTLGGMIGNNSCGVHSIMSGKTVDNIEALEILTYDGLRCWVGATPDAELEAIEREGGRRGGIYAALRSIRERYASLVRERFPDIPRRVSGYNLDELLPEKGFHVGRSLVGSEGTCVTVLEARVRLVPSPQGRVLLVLGYPDVYTAADHVPEVLLAGPIGLEGIDQRLVGQQRKKRMHPEALALLPEGAGWLLVEFGGDDEKQANARAKAFMSELGSKGQPPSMRLFLDRVDQRRIWEVRESALGSTARVPGEEDTWEGWEDAAVAPERLGDYLRQLHKLVRGYGYDCALYGHFGHGCVHNRINFDLKTHAGIHKFRDFMSDAADLVVRFGGSMSGEHGDGQARAELLPKMFGPELIEAFREFKRVWDPDGKMNPGKLVDPYRMDENLRLGTEYRPLQLETEFRYQEDDGAFSRAVARCVGVGKCRKDSGGTMCPSFRATQEEKHSTRGRANLLFEMLRGEVLPDGWRNDAVKEALDLCLSCKGCRKDCPVNVDMATYKAEFLSHYYRGRLRPRSAYAMGLLHWWAPLASRLPRVANFMMRTPGLRTIAKAVAGIAPKRDVPMFARETFRSWFVRRGKPAETGEKNRVLLWPDTFNNYFHPEVLIAAVEVLEHAGLNVHIPASTLCCGRPLYDHGMLARARNLLRQILHALHDDIAAGVPLVALEPGCLSVFRDEIHSFFPHDEDARRLRSQSFTLAELLAKTGYQPPRLAGSAILHGHCHQKAIMGMNADREILDRLGVESSVLDSGCCGMAGAFGFERQHYEISMSIGNQVLFPAVRASSPTATIVSDGFSCREQIEAGTDRSPVHLAQLIQRAIREGSDNRRKP